MLNLLTKSPVDISLFFKLKQPVISVILSYVVACD